MQSTGKPWNGGGEGGGHTADFKSDYLLLLAPRKAKEIKIIFELTMRNLNVLVPRSQGEGILSPLPFSSLSFSLPPLSSLSPFPQVTFGMRGQGCVSNRMTFGNERAGWRVTWKRIVRLSWEHKQ